MSNTWQARYDRPVAQRSPPQRGATENPRGMGPGGMGMYSCPCCCGFHRNPNTGERTRPCNTTERRSFSPVLARAIFDRQSAYPIGLTHLVSDKLALFEPLENGEETVGVGS